ncbi:hypothetical protein [Methanolobus sp. WCC5]|uniref:hypothetical protein n=1 Tax=Methanolobus sp. WCC5 TaxID=3125785 RepID=UPI00324B4652
MTTAEKELNDSKTYNALAKDPTTTGKALIPSGIRGSACIGDVTIIIPFYNYIKNYCLLKM